MSGNERVCVWLNTEGRRESHPPPLQLTRFLRVSGTALTSTGSRSMALTKRASATAMAQMTWTHLAQGRRGGGGGGGGGGTVCSEDGKEVATHLGLLDGTR